VTRAEKPTTRVAFGDVVQLSKERSADPASDGFERYVGLDHLDPRDLRVRRWGDTADGTTFTSVFRPGQVLFGKRRAYQRKVAVANFEGVCSGDIYVLEPRNSALWPSLLPFICQTDAFFEHAIGTSAGSLSTCRPSMNSGGSQLLWKRACAPSKRADCLRPLAPRPAIPRGSRSYGSCLPCGLRPL
jgi:hypothetical protein